MNDRIEKIRELILEDEKFFTIVKDIKKIHNRYYIKDTCVVTPEWIIGAHDHRVFLLDEIEWLILERDEARAEVKQLREKNKKLLEKRGATLEDWQ